MTGLAVEQPLDRIVWTTTTGGRYHLHPHASYSSGAITWTRGFAEELGYRPCAWCFDRTGDPKAGAPDVVEVAGIVEWRYPDGDVYR